jgi:hypothetical protein
MRAHRFATMLALLALLLGSLSAYSPGAAAGAVPNGRWTPVAAPLAGEGPLFPLLLLPLPANQPLLLSSTVRDPEPRTRSQRYDPATGGWSDPLPLTTPHRAAYAAAPLADGVLVVGGIDAGGPPFPRPTLATAERTDPAGARWTPTAPMTGPRAAHTATTLADGRVLVAGGERDGAVLATAEIYDPARDAWTPAAGMVAARSYHAAARLPDGRVLVTGGYSALGGAGRAPTATAEVYDPATDRWATAAPLATPRAGHRATPLGNGQVLVDGPPLERYDPGADRWLPVAPPPTSLGDPTTRAGFSVTPLSGGEALVAGGAVREDAACTGRFCRTFTLPDTQRYDPATDRWRADAPLTAPRSGHQAVGLPDGRVLVVGGGTPDVPPTAELYTPPPGSVACFAETGRCAGGRFLDYWQGHGGLARNGFPLSAERPELLEDGRVYTVQYFERVRLEYHPENAPPFDVLLGQFGRRILRAGDESGGVPDPAVIAPVGPVADAAYFPETGHTLGGRFRAYWGANGGLAQFGYPLTEEFEQDLAIGFAQRARYRVQYFERARFEYHPENAAPYDVLLGQFGRRVLVENDQLAPAPGVKLLYTANERVQGLLGPATADPLTRTSGTYQGFERGAMLYVGTPADGGGIYVLCGGEGAGRLIPGGGSRPTLSFPDPWDPGQPVGGGPGPQPGLYEPGRGFGALWRENRQVRDCLGYATAPGETASTVAAKSFLRGRLLAATTPTGRFIYAVYGTPPDPGWPLYERYPDPIP